MQGFGNSPSSAQSKVTSYSIKEVKRRPVRHTAKNIGNTAAQRGWDEVAAAKDEAFGGDDDDNE